MLSQKPPRFVSDAEAAERLDALVPLAFSGTNVCVRSTVGHFIWLKPIIDADEP
jgi:hypothetical protein